MNFRLLGLLAIFSALPTFAIAQGCPPIGGTANPTLEALNEFLLNGDYAKFTDGVRSAAKGKITLDMTPISNIFPDGLDSCTTIAQRSDPAGMSQHLVIFRGKGQPLFVYWRIVPWTSGFILQTIKLDTSLGPALEQLH